MTPSKSSPWIFHSPAKVPTLIHHHKHNKVAQGRISNPVARMIAAEKCKQNGRLTTGYNNA